MLAAHGGEGWQVHERIPVAIKKRAMTSEGTRVERRRTRRFAVAVPIEVSWRGMDGIAVKEDALASRIPRSPQLARPVRQSVELEHWSLRSGHGDGFVLC